MKKLMFWGFLVTVALNLYAKTEYRDACRQVIYAVKPVEAVSKLDDARLRTLVRYALGITVQGQDSLNENDSYLFSWLANTELARRTKTPDEFSLYLQERREDNAPHLKNLDATAVKIDGWIDLFQLNLILSN